MRKNNLKKRVITIAVAGLMVAQAAMPVMAAPTNNAMEKLDKDANAYTEKELMANGHTTFGVFESGSKVSDKQVSFEVPLYVTMAAVKGQNEMTLPSKGSYYIENTVTDPQKNPIGLVGLKADKYAGSKWSIVNNEADVKAQYDMTFVLDKYKFTNELDNNMELDFYNWKNWDTNGLVDKKSTSFVLAVGDANAVGDTEAKKKVQLKQITGKQDVDLTSVITATNKTGAAVGSVATNAEWNRADSQTTNVFKVTYTVALVDPTTGQPMASTYVGDSEVGAKEYYNWSSVQ